MHRMYIALLIALLVPGLVLAHGDGISYEATVGGYKVDIGYDPEEPRGGDRIVFDFGTLATLEGKPADFDYVWVRIERGTETLLAAAIPEAEFGPTSLLYALPGELSGAIEVHVRYQKGDEVLADTSFPLEVAASDERGDLLLLGVGSMAFVLGVAIGMFVGNRRIISV